MMGTGATFGLVEEQRDFEVRRARFLEVWPRLQDAIDRVAQPKFSRLEPSADAKVKAKVEAQKLVYTMGQVAIEDFMEIALVCANGYGTAGYKLLRPMYEMTITAMYISRNPEEAEAFINYGHVHRRKFFTIAEHAGIELSDQVMSKRDEIEEKYQSIKDQYRQVTCEACGIDRPLQSWTKKSLTDLAREVEFPQSAMWLNYLPTLHIHATPFRLESRLSETTDRVVVESGPRRDLADQALFGAHVCLNLVLAELNGYFELGLEQATLDRDFKYAWPRPA